VTALLLTGLINASQTPSQTGEVPKPLKQLTLEELGNIEITSVSKKPEQVRKTPAAIYVITQEDIRRSGATSIPEVLRLAPGVEVAQVDSNKWSLGIRGFGSRLSRSVLVLMDGRSVYTPLFAGVYWEVQDTLLEDVDRIEIIRGPGGTVWGANAVNGVINIITKNAKETHGVLASAGGGSLDQGFFGLRYGGHTQGGLNYRVYGKAFGRDTQFHPDGRHFDDWRIGQAGFRTDWDSQARDTWTLQGDLYNGDTGQRTAITTLTPLAVTNVEGNAELSGGNLVGRWRRALGEGSDVQIQAYFDRTLHGELSFAETRNTFDFDFLHRLSPINRQTILWGVGYRVSSGDVRGLPTVAFVPNQRTDHLFTGFLQDEITVIADRLHLTVGAKVEHNGYSGVEVQPNARLLWTPNLKQTVWTAISRAVRTPSRVEADLQLSGLLQASPPVLVRLVGNKSFSSESLLGYEIGYRNQVNSKLSFDVAAFFNDYNDLLSIEPGAPFPEASPAPPHLVVPFFLANGVGGKTYGTEIATDFRPVTWWRTKASYSFVHLDLKTSPHSTDTTTFTTSVGKPANSRMVIGLLFTGTRKRRPRICAIPS